MTKEHWRLIGAASLLAMLTGCRTPAPVSRSSHFFRARVKDFPSVYDFYPVAAEFYGEKGTAIVEVCIGPNGKFATAPRIVKSTGFPRLDRAALAYFRATSGDWIPGVRNGVPVTLCHGIPITFSLKGK